MTKVKLYNVLSKKTCFFYDYFLHYYDFLFTFVFSERVSILLSYVFIVGGNGMLYNCIYYLNT